MKKLLKKLWKTNKSDTEKLNLNDKLVANGENETKKKNYSNFLTNQYIFIIHIHNQAKKRITK